MLDRFFLGIINFIFKGIARLPFSALYVISDFLYYLVYYVVRYRRKMTRRNIARSFPEATDKELRSIEKKFYRHFADSMVETIKLLHITDDEMRRRFRFKNIEVIEYLRSDGRPVFLYLGHYANWEYVTSITLWLKEGYDGFQVYHPLKNKVMDKFFYDLRSRFHTVSLPQKMAPRAILKSARAGKQPILGLIADQRPHWGQAGTWIDFLNQKTPIITGGEAMGQRLNAHFVYFKIDCVRRGYYEVTISQLIPDEKEEFSVSKQFMKLLEKDIQAAPQYWLWSHNRWKFDYDEYMYWHSK